jgi:hypothetical protein
VLGNEAEKMMKQAADLVRTMEAEEASSKSIAGELTQRFGTVVTPSEVANGNDWWKPTRETTADRPQPWTKKEKVRIKQWYNEGKTAEEIVQALKDYSGREVSLHTLRTNLRRFGVPLRTETQGQWTREANLKLAQLHQGGDTGRSIFGLAHNLSKALGAPYMPDRVRTQINVLRLNPRTTSRAWANAAIHQWQPDALELLKAHAGTMTAMELAEKIYRKTGQVVTKNAVIARLGRLREEKMRAELAEDLAEAASRNRGTT